MQLHTDMEYALHYVLQGLGLVSSDTDNIIQAINSDGFTTDMQIKFEKVIALYNEQLLCSNDTYYDDNLI